MDTTPDSTMDTMPGTTMDSMPGTTMSDAGEDPALGYEAAEAGAGAMVDKRVHDGVRTILEPDMERVRAEAKHLYEMDRAVTKMVDGIVQKEREKMDAELTMTIKKDHHALAERIKKKAAQMEQEANELEQSSMLTPTSDSEPTTMDSVPGSTMDSMQGTTMDSMPVSTMDSMNDDDHDDDHKPLAEHSPEPPLNYNVGDLPEGFPKAMAEHVGIQDGVALIENCGVPQDIVDFLNKTDSNIEKLDEYFNNHPHYGTFDIAAMLKEMETTWKEHGVCHLDDDHHDGTMDTMPGSTMDSMPGSMTDSMNDEDGSDDHHDDTMDTMPGSMMDSMPGSMMDSMPGSMMDSMNDEDGSDDHH